eukprot:4355677-Pleurochrysis_carterae.AAC.6
MALFSLPICTYFCACSDPYLSVVQWRMRLRSHTHVRTRTRMFRRRHARSLTHTSIPSRTHSYSLTDIHTPSARHIHTPSAHDIPPARARTRNRAVEIQVALRLNEKWLREVSFFRGKKIEDETAPGGTRVFIKPVEQEFLAQAARRSLTCTSGASFDVVLATYKAQKLHLYVSLPQLFAISIDRGH